MAILDLRRPGTAPFGVPGAFQMQNTTYTFEIDWSTFDGLREATDRVTFMNLPLGFIVTGGCIDVISPGTNGYTLELRVGTSAPIIGAEGRIVLHPGNSNDVGRFYSADGNFVIADDQLSASPGISVDGVGNELFLITGGFAPTNGKQKITVTGSVLESRNERSLNV